MNTVSQFTPNYTQNLRCQNVQFRGNIGDKFVNKILNGSNLQPKEVLNEIKGTFGVSSSKTEDVMESFVGTLKQFFNEKLSLTIKVNEQERKINAFPQEKRDAVAAAEKQLHEHYQYVIRTKNKEVAAKNEELADMKAKLEKYQQVAKVKSIEELDTVMPDKAIEILQEMVKNEIPARKSMVEFLLTGKGQQEALAQIERNNSIMKAHMDGVTQIPEVDKQIINNQANGIIRFSSPSNYTINMIEAALKGSPKGSYLKSKAIRQQIKDNAMAIVAPMADNKYYNSNAEALSKSMDGCLQSVEKFHDGLAKGMEKLKASKNLKEVKFEPVEFDPGASKVYVIPKAHREFEENYYWLADFGNSCYNDIY